MINHILMFFMINFRNYFLKLMRKILDIIIFLLPAICYGQIKSTGTPYIINYQKTVYEAGTQNWGITQDDNGFMYFANNDGLLIFDGIHWELVKISPSSAIRSVCIDKENTIYIGLFNDFGILRNNISGEKKFESLRHLIPDQITDFEDIWRIWDTQFGIVFQTFQYLFILKDNQIKVVKPNKKFHFSFVANNRLFLNEPGIGLFEYNGERSEKADWAEKIKNVEIWACGPKRSTARVRSLAWVMAAATRSASWLARAAWLAAITLAGL